jgi:hypothetical protein
MRRVSRAGLILGICLFVAPATAKADFVWAPMLYLYSYSVWWVVVAGLLIEGTVYFFSWRRGWWNTLILTLGINIASAVGGAVLSFGSLLFLHTPAVVMVNFVRVFPVLVFAATVGLEYIAGTRVFSLPQSWKTVGVIAAANVPSVGLAIYETIDLATKAL